VWILQVVALVLLAGASALVFRELLAALGPPVRGRRATGREGPADSQAPPLKNAA